MKRRAFTLLEVVVAMVMGVIVMGTVVAVILVAVQNTKRARTIAAMQRDMAFVGQLLSTELRQAGLGVPFDTDLVNPPVGQHIVSAFGGFGTTSFYARVLVAANSQVGIVGDLPRDDANYPAFGALHSRALNSQDNHVMWHNENNGACAQDSTAGTCRVGDTSTFFPAPGANGCTSYTARTCPWRLRRLLPNERLVIADGAGRWATAAFGSTLDLITTTSPITPQYSVYMASLSTTWGRAWPGLVPGVSAPANTPIINISDWPGELPGGGFLSTPDRVFFRLTGTSGTATTCATGGPDYCNIERIRCFGDPDPVGEPAFPGPNDTTINNDAAATRGDFVVNTATVKSNCGALEVVARNVQSLSFTYVDANDAAIPFPINTAALKQSVRRVAYRITFQKDLDGRPVSFVGSGSVRLQGF